MIRTKAALFSTLFLLAFLGSDVPVHAQFFKKLFGGKEEPRRKPAPRPQPKPNTPAAKKAIAKKTSPDEIVYPKSVHKNRYRIDVFVPLYLSECVKGDKNISKDKIPDKAMAGINFYEGVKLAVDTLDQSGYRMDVFVHDVTEPKETPEALIAAKTLDSADLIIGAVPTNMVAPLAQFAKKRTINFISTMSPSDANVKDNPYFTLLQPTLQSHCEGIRKAVSKKYGNTRMFIYHRAGVQVDETAYKALTKDSLFRLTTINAATLPAPLTLKYLFDSTESNVILMPILDANYAAQLLEQLHTLYPNFRFEVYGMPSWKGMNILRKNSDLDNIAIYFTAPYYFDGSTASGQSLASDYKRAFGGKPGEMVFRGYETLSFYTYLLNKYGTIFNPKIADNASAAYTRFDIKPRWDKDFNLLYNENAHLYIYRYQDGNFVVEQ